LQQGFSGVVVSRALAISSMICARPGFDSRLIHSFGAFFGEGVLFEGGVFIWWGDGSCVLSVEVEFCGLYVVLVTLQLVGKEVVKIFIFGTVTEYSSLGWN
jgi:hypothetical protein